MASPSTLNINFNIVAFGDSLLSNNPRLRAFDWTRSINGIQVSSPKSEQYVVPAKSTLSVFSGVRATTLDGTSAFSLAYLVDNTYRFSYTGGTEPSLATNIPLTFTNRNLTVAANSNQTITISDTTAATAFAGLAADDTVYIYNTTDNVSAVFNVDNSGSWIVLAATPGVITLARPEGVDFSAYAQSLVAVNASGNLIAFRPKDRKSVV